MLPQRMRLGMSQIDREGVADSQKVGYCEMLPPFAVHVDFIQAGNSPKTKGWVMTGD